MKYPVFHNRFDLCKGRSGRDKNSRSPFNHDKLFFSNFNVILCFLKEQIGVIFTTDFISLLDYMMGAHLLRGILFYTPF